MNQTSTSPRSSPLSQHTDLTTPEQTPPSQQDDIWASDTDNGPATDIETARIHNEEMLSELPSLRRQHITSGYREGLSIGKAQVIQSGFDQGYPIGVEIALRAGNVLGMLEGIDAAMSKTKETERKKQVEALLEKAKHELDVKELMKHVEDEVVASERGILEKVEPLLQKWEEDVQRLLPME